MAALANLILAIAIAILLPLLQYVAPASAGAPEALAPAAAAQAPAAPADPAAPDAAQSICVWTSACPESAAEPRTVQILIEKVRVESPCKARVLELAEPAAPARFTFTTT